VFNLRERKHNNLLSQTFFDSNFKVVNNFYQMWHMALTIKA